MTEAERELFAYASGLVTPADVAAFAPDDPGYANYVAAFRLILSSGELPGRCSFDVSETIGLTRWVDAEAEADPGRFRRFRVLTTVVGLAQRRGGVECSDALPLNYSVVSLIHDAYRLADPKLMRLSRPVLAALHGGGVDEESPFALLGTLLVDAYLRVDGPHLTDMAERLLVAERAQLHRTSGDFLLGCSSFDQLHGLWQWLVGRIMPTTSPALRLVRDAILGSGPWPVVHAR